MYQADPLAPLIYSWSSQNTAGDTKKKSVSALVFIGSSAGNIIGPLLYTPPEAPEFSRGHRINLALFISIIALVGLTSAYVAWLNRRHRETRISLGKKADLRDLSLQTAEDAQRWAREDDDEDLEGDTSRLLGQQEDKAFLDATDLENEDFIFVH